MVAQGGVDEEPRQDIDRETFVFVVQCFPGAAFVEKQIEETRILFRQWCSPSFPPRMSRQRGD